MDSQYNIYILLKKRYIIIYTNKTIIMLTEAPTQNIKDWAGKIYSSTTHNVNKMIQTGYHDDVIWESIIFQLLIFI